MPRTVKLHKLRYQWFGHDEYEIDLIKSECTFFVTTLEVGVRKTNSSP